MKNRISALLNEATQSNSTIERHMFHIAILRILLQHACVTLAELLAFRRMNSPNLGPELRQLPISNLREPSDGTLATTLSELLVIAENEGFSGISRRVLRGSDDDRSCWRLIPSEARTVERLIGRLVTNRNDGVGGHGLPGEVDLAAEADALVLISQSLESILPTIAASGDSFETRTPEGGSYTLRLLRPERGHLICFRQIRKTAHGRCMVKAQIERGLHRREEISYETEDPFDPSKLGGTSQRFEISRTYDPKWSPLTLLPSRLTNDFTGRENELSELLDWLDDTESRACMLYGDGGIGKTTLAVEFIHQILDGTLATKSKPEVITFYTAKKTRWGLTGLEIIKTADVGVADVATHIARSIEGKPLDKSWYAKSPDDLIRKLSSLLIDDWGVPRNSHLLVLDNTETMATNPEEVKELARQVRELSRRVGRVLLTSRRREAIEAHQIEIKPLTEEESVKFLRARGAALGRRPIHDAADRTLAKYARSLGNKPLVLEVFVGALGEHGIGLESAFQRVQRMHTQDLGEFLYADAWQRMSDNMRHLLLLMTQVSDIHDDTLMKLCCGQVKLSVAQAYEALEESRGIAQVSRFEDDCQIIFSPEFIKFCGGRSIEIEGNSVPSSAAVDKVKNRYNEFLRSRSAHVWDRVDKAYRHALARVAFTAYREGRDDDCAAFFELAVAEDVENGWLYDRYAVFLSTKFPRRRSEALDWAKMATQLIPKDADAWYTRGTIEMKLGIGDAALSSLERSAALGKPRHLVSMQQANAYFKLVPPDLANARAKLSEAEANEPKNDPLLWKYQAEVKGIRRNIESATRSQI